jgi:predicted SpoU family rRNA methylase
VAVGAPRTEPRLMAIHVALPARHIGRKDLMFHARESRWQTSINTAIKTKNP